MKILSRKTKATLIALMTITALFFAYRPINQAISLHELNKSLSAGEYIELCVAKLPLGVKVNMARVRAGNKYFTYNHKARSKFAIFGAKQTSPEEMFTNTLASGETVYSFKNHNLKPKQIWGIFTLYKAQNYDLYEVDKKTALQYFKEEELNSTCKQLGKQ